MEVGAVAAEVMQRRQQGRLLVEGRIYTGDWRGEAVTDALLVEDGVVRALGPEARARAGSTAASVRLEAGTCAVPGFWDSHIHLASYGDSLDEVPLGDLTDGPSVARRLADAVRSGQVPPDGPVRGRGWMVGSWQGPPPHRRDLDGLGDRPILLWNHDYHSVWVNGAMLREAGIDRMTAEPVGGRIERDADGEPTGILRDEATNLLPEWSETPERVERAILRAQDALLGMGVTAVATMG